MTSSRARSSHVSCQAWGFRKSLTRGRQGGRLGHPHPFNVANLRCVSFTTERHAAGASASPRTGSRRGTPRRRKGEPSPPPRLPARGSRRRIGHHRDLGPEGGRLHRGQGDRDARGRGWASPTARRSWSAIIVATCIWYESTQSGPRCRPTLHRERRRAQPSSWRIEPVGRPRDPFIAPLGLSQLCARTASRMHFSAPTCPMLERLG